MAINYAYYYARLNPNTGMCVGVQDTSNYILDPYYVPIEVYTGNYMMKYYHPIPETVTSHDDFRGKWYTSNSHTTEWNP